MVTSETGEAMQGNRVPKEPLKKYTLRAGECECIPESVTVDQAAIIQQLQPRKRRRTLPESPGGGLGVVVREGEGAFVGDETRYS